VEQPVCDESSLTPTLVSRLQSFYAMLRAVRQRFDDTPDTGLIGKSIQSFFLGIYLSVKRTIGSVIIVLLPKFHRGGIFSRGSTGGNTTPFGPHPVVLPA
jgi:hypothetical protein